jgi:hypothetical protein
LLASERGMCVSRGRADHRRRTRPAERRTAASITSVRDRVREPGRAWRGVVEELGMCRRRRSSAFVARGEGGPACVRQVESMTVVKVKGANLADG